MWRSLRGDEQLFGSFGHFRVGKLAAKNNPAMMHMAEKMMAENTETSGGIDKEKVVHVMTQLAAAS